MHIKEKSLLTNYLTEEAERYDKDLNPKKLEAYWKYLEKYSLDEIKRAFEDHKRDERNFRTWPTITVLEVLINKQLSQRGHHNVYSCQLHSFETSEKACGRPAMVNMRSGHEKTLFVCAEHYELHREKSDIDLEVDRRSAEFEAEAMKLGMTNRQYFFHLRGLHVDPVTPLEIQQIENRDMMKKIVKNYIDRRSLEKSTEKPP